MHVLSCYQISIIIIRISTNAVSNCCLNNWHIVLSVINTFRYCYRDTGWILIVVIIAKPVIAHNWKVKTLIKASHQITLI